MGLFSQGWHDLWWHALQFTKWRRVLSQFVINPSQFVIPVAICNNCPSHFVINQVVAIFNSSIATLCCKPKLFSLVKHVCLPLEIFLPWLITWPTRIAFMKDIKLPVTCHPKKLLIISYIWIKNIKITKATFNNRKFMNNLAFAVQIRIHVCLPRDTWSLRGEEIIPYTWYVSMYRLIGYSFWGSGTLNRVSFFTLLALCLWFDPYINRVTQVVMDESLSFPFCGKSVILNTLVRISRSYELCAYGICFIRGLHRKTCFKMEWVLPLLLYGTKSRENNGPNGQPAECMTPSEFYKIRYIQRYWETNWILCLCFCCGSTICHWWRFCLFAVNILNFSRPCLIKLAKIWKPLLLLLRLRVRQGRCCVALS